MRPESEEWRPVVEYEDLYEASTLGRLRRIATVGKAPKAICRLVAPHKKRTGYCDYWLHRDDKPVRMQAHRVVWCAFMGRIPEGLEINHKDGVRDNNRLDNLELMTKSQNKLHSIHVLGGRKPPGVSLPGTHNPSAKLTDDEVREIRRLYAAGGVYQYELAERFGITQGAVQFIVNRRTWRHIA